MIVQSYKSDKYTSTQNMGLYWLVQFVYSIQFALVQEQGDLVSLWKV